MLQKLTKPSIYIYLVYTVVLFVMALIFATGLESIMTQDNSVPKAILDSREAMQKANNAVFYLFVGGIVGVILLFIFDARPQKAILRPFRPQSYELNSNLQCVFSLFKG